MLCELYVFYPHLRSAEYLSSTHVLSIVLVTLKGYSSQKHLVLLLTSPPLETLFAGHMHVTSSVFGGVLARCSLPSSAPLAMSLHHNQDGALNSEV
jgi:hypothetical protein